MFETDRVRVCFGLPDVKDDYLPLYGGKVCITSDHGEKLSIPYGGLSIHRATGRFDR